MQDAGLGGQVYDRESIMKGMGGMGGMPGMGGALPPPLPLTDTLNSNHLKPAPARRFAQVSQDHCVSFRALVSASGHYKQ